MPGFHHSIAVLPLPFRRSRFRTPLPLPLPLRIVLLLSRLERNGIFLRNVIFTEQWNFTTAERQRKNGNGMVETGH